MAKPPDDLQPTPPSTAAAPQPPDDLKLIRLPSAGINDPDAPHASTYPYKLTVHLSPPDFMQVTFILLHGGSENLIVRSKTRGAIDRFIAQHNFKHHPRLRGMMITDPNGVTEKFPR